MSVIFRFLLIYSFIALQACTGSRRQAGVLPPSSQFPLKLTQEIRNVLPAVVEVVTIIEYDVEEYAYAMDAEGNYLPDPDSPFGFRFASSHPDSMILRRRDQQVAFGSGVLIGKNQNAYLILTSRHIVFHEDSIVQYIETDTHKTTAPLFKAYLRRNDLAIRGENNALIAARLIAEELRSDLALLEVSSRLISGALLNVPVAPPTQSTWGHLAIIVGFPDEIKQVSMGLTGTAPYPGNFSISTYGDFGFSGGPVFRYVPEEGLQFIGIGRSIPAKTLTFVGPDEKLSNRLFLSVRDIPNLRIQRFHLVNPSRIFAINLEYITAFIRKNYNMLISNKYILCESLRKVM